MAYFEKTKLTDKDGNIISPAEDISLLRAIFRLLKPLGVLTGAGSNRLSVDVNAVTSLPTLGTVSTATNVTNIAPSAGTIGGVTGFDLMKAMSRTAYNSGIRSNLS